jgi:hypothetical protein
MLAVILQKNTLWPNLLVFQRVILFSSNSSNSGADTGLPKCKQSGVCPGLLPRENAAGIDSHYRVSDGLLNISKAMWGASGNDDHVAF